MNKWFKYIFIGLTLMFMGFNSVFAKDIDCTYKDIGDNPKNEVKAKLTNKGTKKSAMDISSCKIAKVTNNGICGIIKNVEAKTSECPHYAGVVCQTTTGGYVTSANGTTCEVTFSNSKSDMPTSKVGDEYAANGYTTKISENVVLTRGGREVEDDDDDSTITIHENKVDDCSDLGKTLTLLKKIYNFIKYLVPVIIILFSLLDFAKVIISDEEKTYNDAWSKLVKRLIVGAVILILPALLSFVITISGVTKAHTTIDNNNLFCIFK